ncbi:MAG: UDP-4-amino-4,6-dideoxy-N-acetyl-beta-L-altrosamine transaminase [Candidatus Omnitrophica bacterium]|nr:UDP-4-amino-4,6-dideoxy-N-acetyl-beta-L-altrosamine transaminase [Candidatus Omnitrophota bacterium]
MKIKTKKKYNYGKQTISFKDKIEVLKVMGSTWFTQGPKIKEFENALCDYTGAKYAVAVANGTAALHLCMLAIGVGKDNEVITSPNTFLATANSVLYCGSTPVFADIDAETACIDFEEIKKNITNKTKAIIPVHFAGQSCDMEKIKEIVKGKNIYIIEDAAHALGSRYKDTKVGSCAYSDLTIFSFHPVKNITTGEGGAITTNNKLLYEKIISLRSHGIIKTDEMFVEKGPWYYEMLDLGYNYRITDIQCALGISQLKKIGSFVEKRKKIAEFYRENVKKDIGISTLSEKENSVTAWHLFPMLIDFDFLKISKKYFFKKMKEKGINLQVHYIPVHLQPYYRKNFGYKEGDFPKAESYYKRTVSLPIYPKLREKDLKYIIKSIKESLRCK